MDNDSPDKGRPSIIRQKYFVARELQLTIAFLVVVALLGGIFLQSVSAALTEYLDVKTPALGIFLILGYVALVAFLSIVFSHRLVGPFKRLEYEMKLIKAGELDRRLSLRTNDDSQVRIFIEHVNDLIEDFEAMSSDYNKMSSDASIAIADAIDDLSEESPDREKLKEDLKALQKQLRELREKW